MDPLQTNPPLIITRQSKRVEADSSIWKIAILGVFGAVLNVCAVGSFSRFLESAALGYAAASLLFFGFFCIVAILSAFFVKSARVLGVLAIAWGILPLGAFLVERPAGASAVLVIGFIVYAVLLRSSVSRGARMLQNSVRIRFFEVSRAVLPKATTALILVTGLLSYLSFVEWKTLNVSLGKSIFDQVLVSAEPALKIWLPTTSFRDSTGDFFEKFAEYQLRRAEPDVLEQSTSDFQGGGLSTLPPALRQAAIRQVADELRSSFEKLTGPVELSVPMSETVYRGIISYVNRLPDDMRTWAGVLLAITLAGLLKGIASLFYWLIEGIAFIVYKLLLVTGFARVEVESRSREFIILT